MFSRFFLSDWGIFPKSGSKIRDEPGVGGRRLLGKALQIVQIHPAQHGIVFFIRYPPVKGCWNTAHGGVLAHQTDQNFSRGEGGDLIGYFQKNTFFQRKREGRAPLFRIFYARLPVL